MARTTTAAPAPNDRPSRRNAGAAPGTRKPKNGKVRTVTVPLDVLATASAAELATMALPAPTTPEDKAAAAIALPDKLAAMLGRAKQQEEAKRAKHAKVIEPRVSVTPAQRAALDAAGWRAPKVSANFTCKAQDRTRSNPCKGGPVYTVAAQILTTGQTLHVADLAALWIAAGNAPKPLGAILKQVANRAGRGVIQSGATITMF
jgi:hypothetical protein